LSEALLDGARRLPNEGGIAAEVLDFHLVFKAIVPLQRRPRF
jgi:hypothetical protein